MSKHLKWGLVFGFYSVALITMPVSVLAETATQELPPHHWGLNCERVGKDRMGDVVNALKDGKMVVEICEAYTITGSGSGHFIVLTGVTKDGYITIADCASRERTGKVYSVETIASYGRDLADGAFWIIGK